MTALESAVLDRHVVILTAAGSFTTTGNRLAGPVDTVDKLEKLITWAHQRGGLQPFTGDAEDDPQPARLWLAGTVCGLLTGESTVAEAGVTAQIGQTLAPLVSRGWEMCAVPTSALRLSRGKGAQRFSVEVFAEEQPWIEAGKSAIAENPAVLGRRLQHWYAALGTLPAASGAASSAVLYDHIMRARSAAGRGAVVTTPGVLPAWVQPEVQIQPAWCASATGIEHEFERSEELVRLAQECPQLASAGMLTLGYGQPQALDATSVLTAAAAAKRCFGLWRAILPAGNDLALPAMLPLPHPQMRPDHAVQVWLTTEDLDGLTKDIRDGGASLTIEQLAIDEAIVWPQQGRLLEAWATRLREAREAFRDQPVLRHLVESAAADYLASLTEPDAWNDDAWRHHFQPAWGAAIAAHTRFRGRRAAMRLSREYRCKPIYMHGAAMVYAVGRDEDTDKPIDLSDSHTRLGRLVETHRAALTDKAVLAVLLAESPSGVAEALSGALDMTQGCLDAAPPAGHETPAPPLSSDTPVENEQTPTATDDVGAALTEALGLAPGSSVPPGSGVDLAAAVPETANDEAAADKAETQAADRASTGVGAGTESAPESVSAAPAGHDAARSVSRPRRGMTRSAAGNLGGSPAAVLDVDGLWMPDGTRHDVAGLVTHVGHVAELAYAHHLGYQVTPGYVEQGQIWITEEACRAYGIDVDTVLEKRPKDRDGVLREITGDLPFVVDAAADGWELGGGRKGAPASLGIWTRVYRADQQRQGVWVVLIPGMASAGDSPKDVINVPVLTDGRGEEGGVELCAPARLARRLKLLADGLRFPFKINAGVTAIDLMKASRPKGTTLKEWCNGPLAPSTFDVPFTVNDVEREFNWTRTPTADELRCRFVHAYDRGGSYAAAIAGLELPIGEPVHFPDGSVFEDPARLKQLIEAPGLVTIVVPESQDWRVPFLLNPAGRKFSAPKPMTTARLRYALKQGYAPTIVEAYSWPHHGRVLIGFYERVRDASVVLDIEDPDAQAARNQSKVVRNNAIGLMGSEEYLKGKTGYDPMKRFSIVGKANANIAYRLDQIIIDTGRSPVAVEKDTVLFISDDPDPQAAWPGGPKTWGRGFGQYKHEGSALLADHVEWLNGSHYRGKPTLLDPDEWGELLATLAAPVGAKDAR